MLELARHFSAFHAADPERVHFAAHSHHYWPDAVREGQAEVFADAARLADHKWGLIFGEIIPEVQAGIARRLNLPDASSLAIAPNTHEFVRRLFSLFPAARRLRILTSDSEFHSFSRQVARLEEEDLVVVTRVPAEPFASFPARLAEAARPGFDIAFISHVFFNSGALAGAADALVAAVADHAEIVALDGYHGFMAMPVDLSRIAARAFYMAGSYKYAMAGEGACFMHCPPGVGMRPRDTGWFAAFGSLQARQGGVPYAADGNRFLGATFDPSGLYRQRAVFRWLDGLGIDEAAIHAHVHALQAQFLDGLQGGLAAVLPRAALITPFGPGVERGNFLTFRLEGAAGLHAALDKAKIVTDRRDDRLRFGFGLYHEPRHIEGGLQRMRAVLA